MSRPSEADCAALVVSWLDDLGWDVYQEVRGGPWSDAPVDIVAVRGRVCWAVEVKASCSWKLLGQCADRRRAHGAHMISAACPLPKEKYAQAGVVTAFRALGVGLLQLRPDVKGPLYGDDPDSYRPAPVQEIVRPAMRRDILPSYDLRAFLADEHKSHAAAGSPSGGGWTRFKATCKALLEYAEANPGALLSDACKAIDHHYGSAESAARTLRVQVVRGYVPGVRIETKKVDGRDRVVVHALSAGHRQYSEPPKAGSGEAS